MHFTAPNNRGKRRRKGAEYRREEDVNLRIFEFSNIQIFQLLTFQPFNVSTFQPFTIRQCPTNQETTRQMRSARLSVLLILLTVLFGCDYFEFAEFVVENKTPDIVVIKTGSGKYENGITFPDSVHTINPGEKLTFYQNKGICSRNFVPPDYYKTDDVIPPVSMFKIIAASEAYDTLRVRQFWNHSSGKTVGRYTLAITEELLEGL
jgi:hypothetical protein